MSVYFLPYLQSPITWIVFVFAAVIGSFLNVCIARIPYGTFWKSHRSMCPHCGAPIPGWLNIPIFAWFLLRGRTQCCKSKLSIQYPMVEFLTAVLLVVAYWCFPFVNVVGSQISYEPMMIIRFAHASLFICILIICSFIDLKHMIIPDFFSIGLVVTTPLVVWIHPELDWVSAGVGVVVGFLTLYSIAWLYWIVKHEVGMGMGDVKLLAGIGGWLGYQSIIPTVFYGSITGAVIGIGIILISGKKNLRTAIPFGPFLALGALIHLLMGDLLQVWFFQPNATFGY